MSRSFVFYDFLNFMKALNLSCRSAREKYFGVCIIHVTNALGKLRGDGKIKNRYDKTRSTFF